MDLQSARDEIGEQIGYVVNYYGEEFPVYKCVHVAPEEILLVFYSAENGVMYAPEFK